MAGNVKEFTDNNFQTEVLESSEPVLVDFWAPWCGPCKMLTPAIESLADQYAGKVKIGKVNTDDNRATAMKYRIQSIPTLIVFKNGQQVDQVLGLQPQPALAKLLDRHLG